MKSTTSLAAGALRCGDNDAGAEASVDGVDAVDVNVDAGATPSVGVFPGSRRVSETAVMLSGPHQKFAEGIAKGLTGTDAYLEAYPKVTRKTARENGSRLRRQPEIRAEIARIRKAAEDMLGSAKLTLVEKRDFLARLVRAKVGVLAEDSDLWTAVKQTKFGTVYKLPDKLLAIKLDNDLAADGSDAQAADALAGLLARVRK